MATDLSAEEKLLVSTFLTCYEPHSIRLATELKCLLYLVNRHHQPHDATVSLRRQPANSLQTRSVLMAAFVALGQKVTFARIADRP